MKIKLAQCFYHLISKKKSNYAQIRELLDYLQKNADPIDIFANPYFSMVKPTSENLTRYNFFFPNSRFFLIFDLFFLYFKLVFEISKSLLFYPISRIRNKRVEKEYLMNEFPIFQIMHFTPSHLMSRKIPIYRKSNREFETFTFFLNHTYLIPSLVKTNLEVSGAKNFEVNFPYIHFFTFLKSMKRQIHFAFFLLKMILYSDYCFSIYQFRLIFRGSVHQVSRRTTYNILTAKRIFDLIESYSSRKLYFTAEGHALESLLIAIRNYKYPNIDIVYVQRTPIVLGQTECFSNLRKLTYNDLVIVTGNFYESLFVTQGCKAQISIENTLDNLPLKFSRPTKTRFNILGVPEALPHSTFELLNIYKNLARRFSEVEFVLRPSPDFLKHNFLSDSCLRQYNLSFSNNSLSTDLENADILIFRSSMAGIHGLAFGVFPIHFSAEGNNLLNPLAGTEFEKFGFSNLDEISTFISKLLNFELKLDLLVQNAQITYLDLLDQSLN